MVRHQGLTFGKKIGCIREDGTIRYCTRCKTCDNKSNKTIIEKERSKP